MLLNQFLLLGAFLFATGVYGVVTRRNSVLVLMSVELMLAAVNVNLVAFSASLHNAAGQVFALFVLTIAAAEVDDLLAAGKREVVEQSRPYDELPANGRVQAEAGAGHDERHADQWPRLPGQNRL